MMYSEIHPSFYRRAEHGSFNAQKSSVRRNIIWYKSGELNELWALQFKRQLKQEPSSNHFLNNYLTASFSVHPVTTYQFQLGLLISPL